MNVKRFNVGSYDAATGSRTRCTNCMAASALAMSIIALVWLLVDTLVVAFTASSTGTASSYMRLQESITKDYSDSGFPEWFVNNCGEQYSVLSDTCKNVFAYDPSADPEGTNKPKEEDQYYCEVCGSGAQYQTSEAIAQSDGIYSKSLVYTSPAGGDSINDLIIKGDEYQQKFQMLKAYLQTNYMQFAHDYYTAGKNTDEVLSKWWIKASECTVPAEGSTESTAHLYLCNYCDGVSEDVQEYNSKKIQVPPFCENITGILTQETYDKLADYIALV